MSDFLSYTCNTPRGEVQAMRRSLKKEILWLLEYKGIDRHENTVIFLVFHVFSHVFCALYS